MQKPYFGRLLTAMITCMNEDGSINYDACAAHSEWLLANGSDAILVEGTTGETPTFTQEEKLALIDAVCKRIGGKAPIIVGAGSNNTAATAAYCKEIEEKFPDVNGLLIVGPYYNKPTQEGFYQHFAAVAKATKLPIIVYNVPGRTGSNIMPATIARLANDFENIVAVKEAAGNVAQTAELYRLVPEDFSIYSGDDGLILPFMAVGAVGLISVLSNIGGQELNAVMDAFQAGNIKLAADLNKTMVPLANAMFVESNPIPIKAAVTKVTPFNAGAPRLPLVPISAAGEAKLDAALKAAGRI